MSQLTEMIGESTPVKDPTPKINLKVLVSDACKLKEPPANTESVVTNSELQDIKAYLQDLDPALMVPRIAESYNKAGIDPAFALTAQSAAMYLKSALPTGEYELTPFGMRRVVSPSKSEDTKFTWKCQVVQNPFYVMNLFSQRQLTGLDMDALEAVYPQEYAALSKTLIEYMMEHYSADTAVPRPLRTMVSIFFRAPTISLQQLAAYKNQDVKSVSNAATEQAPNVSQLEGKR